MTFWVKGLQPREQTVVPPKWPPDASRDADADDAIGVVDVVGHGAHVAAHAKVDHRAVAPHDRARYRSNVVGDETDRMIVVVQCIHLTRRLLPPKHLLPAGRCEHEAAAAL